jgi:hypothetical protein
MNLTELDLEQFRKTGTDKDLSNPKERWRELLADLRFLGNNAWPTLLKGEKWGEWTKEDAVKYFAKAVDSLRSVYFPVLEQKREESSYWDLYWTAKDLMQSKPPPQDKLKEWEEKRSEIIKTSLQEGAFDKLLFQKAQELKDIGIIVLIPNYASWSGSNLFSKGRPPNDFEWIVKNEDLSAGEMLKLERLAKHLFPNVPPHFVSSVTGPNWRNMPVYDLALVPKPEFEIRETDYPDFQDIFYESAITEQAPRAASPEIRKQGEVSKKQDTIKPDRFFLAMKPVRVTEKGERQSITNLIKALPENSYEAGWYASKKYDGMAIEIHKWDDKVKIFSEDGEIITDKLPRIVKGAKELDPKDFVMLAELEYWDGEKHLPREVAAGQVHAKVVDDKNLLANTFDMVYYDKDIHKEPFSTRRKILDSIKFPQSTTGVPSLKHAFNLAPDFLVKTPEDLKEQYEKLRETVASEGFVIKQANSPYYLDLNPRKGWYKLHENTTVDGIVIERIPTKTKGVFNYRYAIDPEQFAIDPKDTVEIKGKKYLEVGKSFSTDTKLNPGDILTIEGETVNLIEDKRNKVFSLTVWAPRFLGKSELTKPNSIGDVLRKAERAGVLVKKILTPEGETIYQLVESEFDIDYLTEAEIYEKYPELISEIQAKKFLENQELEIVDAELIEQEDKEFAKALKRAEDASKKAPIYSAIFDIHYRGKSAHKDFRIKKNGFLEGWTITDLPKGEITEPVETLELAKKFAEKVDWKFFPDMKPTTHVVARPKAKEPLAWLKFNNKTLGKHAIVPPGSVGATRFEPGVFYNYDEGLAYPTVKKPAFEEYFLDMPKFKGRMVIRLVPVGKEWEEVPKGEIKGQWQTWFNMTEQTPYLLTRRARTKKDYVPDSEEVVPSGLPPEWEKKIPTEFKWWDVDISRAEKLKRMDQAYNALIDKGELKGRKLEIKESEIEITEAMGKGILRFHYSRGPKVIRGMPSEWSHYDLVIDTNKKFLDEWNLDQNPITNPSGVNAFRKKESGQTPQGKPNKDWMQFEGVVPPPNVSLKKVQIVSEISWDGSKGKWRYRIDNVVKESKEMEYRFKKDEDVWADKLGNLYNANKSIGNPEKVLPAYYKIVDKFDVNWIEDQPLFSRFQFKGGKLLKGLWIMKRGSVDDTIWTFQKSARPGEPKESLEASNLDLPLLIEHNGKEYTLTQTAKGGLILK